MQNLRFGGLNDQVQARGAHDVAPPLLKALGFRAKID